MKIKKFCGGYDRNFAYVIYDEKSKKAITIDPVIPNDIVDFLKKEKLEIVYLINTHSHFDHVSGNEYVLANTKAKMLKLVDGEEQVVGNMKIQAIATPGHTEDSICIMVDDKALFTGDTLFVGKIGGTGSKEDSIKEISSLRKLMELDDKITIYPGHDYGEKEVSTIKEEKETNPFILRIQQLSEFLDLKEHWGEYKKKHNIK